MFRQLAKAQFTKGVLSVILTASEAENAKALEEYEKKRTKSRGWLGWMKSSTPQEEEEKPRVKLSPEELEELNASISIQPAPSTMPPSWKMVVIDLGIEQVSLALSRRQKPLVELTLKDLKGQVSIYPKRFESKMSLQDVTMRDGQPDRTAFPTLLSVNRAETENFVEVEVIQDPPTGIF